MTDSVEAQLNRWTQKAWDRAEYVVRGSIQDTAEQMSVARDGLVRGAPFQTGVVPVHEGELIGSLVVEIEGSVVARGSVGSATPPNYEAALAEFALGEKLIVGFTADHAQLIEYGFRISSSADDTDDYGKYGDFAVDSDVPGRFMVRGAIQNFQYNVDMNAEWLG